MKKKDKRISNLERYVNRQSILQDRILPPRSGLKCCIVIPSYDEKELMETLHSLSECDVPAFPFEVIIVLNSSEQSHQAIRVFHREQYELLRNSSFSFPIHPILLENIAAKKAGVGFARKSGMDLAARRLLQTNPLDGIIVCLDGDCQVSKNYLTCLIDHFDSPHAKQAAHLHFEHPLPNDERLKKSIVEYELHLRLMKLQLQATGHPQAFHAVGSCLAVRAWAYASQGGMNTRQAGEDFYFIHKFSAIGQLQELHDAIVYPASRESSRVPFGTGAAMKKNMNGHVQLTYNPDSYKQIAKIIEAIPEFRAGNYRSIHLFLEFKSDEIKPKLEEIRQHTSNLKTFEQRFFHWFDAFQVIKYLHFLRDKNYVDVTIYKASEMYAKTQNISAYSVSENFLITLRQIERRHDYDCLPQD